jgi:prophage regulatory protein
MRECPIVLRKNEVARRTGLSVRHLERLESVGRFPRRIRLSSNSAGWVESEVADWLMRRIAASRSAALEAAAPTAAPGE